MKANITTTVATPGGQITLVMGDMSIRMNANTAQQIIDALTIAKKESMLITLTPKRTNYEMYTDRGDEAVGRLIASIEEEALGGSIRNARELGNVTMAKMRLLARSHPEVNDTEPRGYIMDAIEAIAAERGWSMNGISL